MMGCRISIKRHLSGGHIGNTTIHTIKRLHLQTMKALAGIARKRLKYFLIAIAMSILKKTGVLLLKNTPAT